jgi:hypothetical protein
VLEWLVSVQLRGQQVVLVLQRAPRRLVQELQLVLAQQVACELVQKLLTLLR